MRHLPFSTANTDTLNRAVDDAVRALPLRDPSRKGKRYAKELIYRILNLVPGLKMLDSEPPLLDRRLNCLIESIDQLECELNRLVYPDRVLWQLNSLNAGKRMRNPDLPSIDEMLRALKKNLTHLGKLARDEQHFVKESLKPHRRREKWRYFLVLECHTVFVELCEVHPTTTPDGDFSRFVSKVYECATGEPCKTLQDQIRSIIRSNPSQ